MAPKTRKKKKLASRLVRSKSNKVWEAGTVDQWLQFAKQNKPDPKTELKVKGMNIVTNCVNPSHNDENPSMVISPTKGFVKCYSCHYYEWNALRFWSAFTQKSHAETARNIQASIGAKILTKTETDEMEKEFSYAQMKNGLFEIFRSTLVDAYTEWMAVDRDEEKFKKSSYGYAMETLKYLEFRKVASQMEAMPFGILPDMMTIKSKAEALTDIDGNPRFGKHDIEGMDSYLQKYMKTVYLGSLVFVYHSTPTDVATFRIRLQNESDDKKRIIAIDDPHEDRRGFFGLNMYNNLSETGEGIGNTTKAFLTEGEFDQAHYATEALPRGDNDIIILAHGGLGNVELSELKNFGIKDIFYLKDYDEGGDTNAWELMQGNQGFNFRLFQWPIEILDPKKDKTDLDDALHLYGFEAVKKSIMELDKNWIKPELWAKDQVQKKIQRSGLEEDDHTEISKIVCSYASCIGDSSQSNQAIKVNNWITRTLEELGVSGEDAKKMANDHMSRESPEHVFCDLIRRKLKDYFEFIGIDRTKKTYPVKLWDKNKHTMMEMQLGSDAHIKATLSSSLGKLVDWVKEEISIPEFIKYTVTRTGEYVEIPLPKQEEEIGKFFLLSVKDVAKDLAPLNHFQTYSAGNHWLPTKNGDCMFGVNGDEVLKISYDQDGIKDVESLETPVWEDHLFDTAQPKWSKKNVTLENIKKAQTMSLQERLETTIDIIDKGWTFEDNYVESRMLAAFICASPVLQVFPKNLQFLASNERSTGKSTLYGELIGGAKNTDINLVEHVKFVDNATPAGIRQTMNGSSLTLVHDEFDDDSNSRYQGDILKEIQKIFRACSEGEGKITHGSQFGEGREYYMNFSVFVAGINPDIGNASMTRFMTTDLKAGLHNKAAPRTSILEKYSIKDIERLRSSISIDTYKDVPKFLQSYNTVKKYCDENSDMLDNTSMQRFKDNMYILMAILHAGGQDWKLWCQKTCLAKSELNEQMKKRTNNNALIMALTHSANVACSDLDRSRKTVADFYRVAAVETERAMLNNSGAGVFMYEDEEAEKWYLVVLWQQALSGVLRGTQLPNMSNNPYSLQNVAEKHPDVLSVEAARFVLDKLDEVPMYFQNVPHSVIDITKDVQVELLKQERIRQKASNQIAKKETQPTLHC